MGKRCEGVKKKQANSGTTTMNGRRAQLLGVAVQEVDVPVATMITGDKRMQMTRARNRNKVTRAAKMQLRERRKDANETMNYEERTEKHERM